MWFLLPLVLLAACGTIPDDPKPTPQQPGKDPATSPDVKALQSQLNRLCDGTARYLSQPTHPGCGVARYEADVRSGSTRASVYGGQTAEQLKKMIADQICPIACEWETDPERGTQHNRTECEANLLARSVDVGGQNSSNLLICAETTPANKSICRSDLPRCPSGTF